VQVRFREDLLNVPPVIRDGAPAPCEHDSGCSNGHPRFASQHRGQLSVLYVAEAFGGGMFEITRTEAEGMARAGHRVAIAYGVRPETPHDLHDRLDPLVELIPLPWTSRTLAAQVRAYRALRKLCRVWKPDVVHLMSSYAGLHGALAIKDVPKVYTPQAYAFTMASEPAYKRWAYLIVESFVARRVDLVGACSLSEGAQARSLPGARSVAVVPNGIEELSHKPPVTALEAKPEPTVVAVGRPLPQRQPEACARILSAVSDCARVRWIGGGTDDGGGQQALAEAGIPLTGWMPRPLTLAALRDSMLYLHWTAWDGLPLSVLEAMALDVVVVASDIGPNRELLGPRQVCRTEQEAITLLRRLIADPDLRKQFLDDQRARRQSYGADEMVSRWTEIYWSLQAPDRLRTSTLTLN
jgi:glycosyltransferase involved in cell wall biosynthesis